jgi:hypothetical protein
MARRSQPNGRRERCASLVCSRRPPRAPCARPRRRGSLASLHAPLSFPRGDLDTLAPLRRGFSLRRCRMRGGRRLGAGAVGRLCYATPRAALFCRNSPASARHRVAFDRWVVQFCTDGVDDDAYKNCHTSASRRASPRLGPGSPLGFFISRDRPRFAAFKRCAATPPPVAMMLDDDEKGCGLAPPLASLQTVDAPNRLPRPTKGATVPAMSGVPAPGS